MTGKVSIAFLDKSGEISRVEYNVPVSSAANVEGQIDDSQVDTALSTAALIASLSLCTPISSQLVASTSKWAQTPPGSLYAQRELGLKVTYSDNVTGKLYQMTIPAPDWANIGSGNSDQVDPADAAWIAFKAKFETEAVSEVGNPITVTGGRLVGRNR